MIKVKSSDWYINKMKQIKKDYGPKKKKLAPHLKYGKYWKILKKRKEKTNGNRRNRSK